MLVERVIFFDGMVYQIEEEVYSDSDHSSVYTSEDSFEVDEDLQNQFTSINPLFSEHTESIKKSISTAGGFTETMEKKSKVTKDDSKASEGKSGDDASGIDMSDKDGDVTPKQKKGKKGKKGKDEKEEDTKTKGKEEKKEEKKSDSKPKKPKKEATGVKKKKAGDAPLRFHKKEVLYRNSPGLSQLQTDYESKLWPRHYLDNVMENRMKRFDEIEEEKKAMKSPKQAESRPTEAVE